MRKILFKMKRKSDNKWIYWSPFCGVSDKVPTSIPIDTEIQEFDFPYEIILDTLCQYIGRDDKFGNPIFEGDVVRTQYGRLCSVVWFDSPNDVGWDLHPLEDKHPYPDGAIWDIQYLEVVGNIFDDLWSEVI